MNKNLIKNYKRTRKRDGNFYRTPGVEVEFYGGRGPEFYSATIFYKGYEFDYFDVEDELYDMCKEEYGKRADDDDFFERYVQKNVKHLLDEMIYTGEVEKEDSYKDTRRKPMRRDVRTTLHGSKRARKTHDWEIEEEEFGTLYRGKGYEDALNAIVQELNDEGIRIAKPIFERLNKKYESTNDIKEEKYHEMLNDGNIDEAWDLLRKLRNNPNKSWELHLNIDSYFTKQIIKDKTRDSKSTTKTFIVKARNEKDAVLKLKRYLKK